MTSIFAPMARERTVTTMWLIDLDELAKHEHWKKTVRDLSVAPTINPEDLRPHGWWIQHNKENNNWVECSECNTVGSPFWKCCPVCTAMMSGKENEDA